MHLPLARYPYSSPAAPRTILVLMANALDRDVLTNWCQNQIECDGVDGTASLAEGLDFCRRHRPGLVLLDPTGGEDAIPRALTALRHELMHYLLVLDRRPLEGRLIEVLGEPSASYLSRAAGQQALAAAIGEIFKHGRRVFDPALAPRIRLTERGYSFEQSPLNRSIAALSMRERQVMRLLAEGRSVQQCADALGLSHSTIDNHKSRLMKKLGIHKASELTYRAIRDGLLAI
jgi:DNA-binding NarL/FixJ family response regulator